MKTQNTLLRGLKRITLFFGFLMLAPFTPYAQNAGEAKVLISKSADFTKQLFTAPPSSNARTTQKSTEKVLLRLPGNHNYEGQVGLHKTINNQESIAGTIGTTPGATFNITVSNGKVSGHVILLSEKSAYKYSTDSKGDVYAEKTDINKLICVEYGKADQTVPAPAPAPAVSARVAAAAPSLQSFPGAPGVIYLDTDGEYVVHPGWNGGNPINALSPNFSAADITTVWEEVSEDFRPFNLNVTTDEAVFLNAAPGKRIRVVVTPTSQWYGGALGVAYIGSFQNTTSELPCWVFTNNVANNMKEIADVASHETGHTLGLAHDGALPPAQTDYYGGHGNWGPLMGSIFFKKVTQWSRGEYQYANNTEDDILIISGPENGVGFRNDDHADTHASATLLSIDVSNHVHGSGVISTPGDQDFFAFTAKGGAVYFSVKPKTASNLNIKAEVYNANNALVASVNPLGDMSAFLNLGSLAAGTYYLHIDGEGEENPLTDGYSDYGSLGAFTIEGVIGDPMCPYAAWSASQTYSTGNKVNYNGQLYTAKWWTTNQNPASNSGQGGAWQLDGNCSANEKPVIVIASPALNTVFHENQAITLTATATDGDGTISRVEFYQDDTLVLTKFEAPYTYTRNNLPGRLTNLSVVAYDNKNKASNRVYFPVNVNQLPLGHFTSPQRFSFHKSPVTINVDASDPDGTIAKVEYFYTLSLQGTPSKIGEVTTAPYTFISVLPANFAQQDMILVTAIITDNAGGKKTIESPFYVSENTTSVVTITSPANNAVFAEGSNIVISANVTGPGSTNIAYVDFSLNANGYTRSTTAPYTYTLTNAASGTYTLRAVAVDNLQHNSVPVYVTFKVGTATNQLPAVILLSPPVNTTKYKTGGKVEISAVAFDSDGQLEKVEISSPHIANSTRVFTTLANPFTVTYTKLASSGARGYTTFTVKAYDNAGGITTKTFDLLENKAPSVNFSSPANNTQFSAGSSVTLVANPADTDGPVNCVNFYNNTGVLVGSVTSAPYQLVLTDLPIGNYSYTAIAYDELFTASTSAAISFSVTGSATCTIPAWNNAVAYTTGQRVSYQGTVYEAKWWTQAANPAAYSGTNDVWKVIGACNARNEASPKTASNTISVANNLKVQPVPLEDKTSVILELGKAGLSNVGLYDINGVKVIEIVNEDLPAGTHQYEFNTAHLSSGIYVIRLVSENGTISTTVTK